jgi:hypothetical protein
MKRLLVIFIILCSLNIQAQIHSKGIITPSSISIDKGIDPMISGSCGSPEGSMLQIPNPPSGYYWLDSAGYCYKAGFSSQTTCFTFISPGTDVNINMGFGATGCNTITFSNINLFSSGTCILIGGGLSFSGLSPGSSYTWCIKSKCTGGGQFDSICPYFQDVSPLPITLLSFNAYYQDRLVYFNWVTATETNNNYFELQRTSGDEKWSILLKLTGAGNSSERIEYRAIDMNAISGDNYYRLKQVDFNGNFAYSNTIELTIPFFQKKIIRITNELGQAISTNTKGFYVIYYDNGTILKGYKY